MTRTSTIDTKKEIDGKVYILQEKVEEIVTQRISKHASKSSELQTQLDDLRAEFENAKKASANAAALKDKLTELEGKLSNTTTQYNTYKAISSKGITDPEVIKLFQWSYKEDQKDKKEKDRIQLQDWISHYMSNPDKAPVTIRPFIPKATAAPAPEPKKEQSPEPQTQTQSFKPPKTSTNVGAVNASPENLQWKVRSLEEYEQQRAAMLAALKKSRS